MNRPLQRAAPRRSIAKLLPLTLLLFAGLWWATAKWGVAAVEKKVLDDRILMPDYPRDASHGNYPPPDAFVRITDQQFRTTETPIDRFSRTHYYIKTYSPFPLVVRCEYYAPGKMAKTLHLWFFRWTWSRKSEPAGNY